METEHGDLRSSRGHKFKRHNTQLERNRKGDRGATMLGDRDTTARIAVKDIRLPGNLHQGAVVLKHVRTEESGVLLYTRGSSGIRISESKDASTNKATPIGWTVGDEIDGLLQSLQLF